MYFPKKQHPSFYANSVTPPPLPSYILEVFQSIILTFLIFRMQTPPLFARGNPCWCIFSRQLLQKPLGKKLWSKMHRGIKEALEYSGFFWVGKDWDVFLPGTVHPLTSGTAHWLGTPALVSIQYSAVQRWDVFKNEAGSLPCRSQCSDLRQLTLELA